MEVYLVGGAVRDKLLGLPVKERDWVVVGATAEQMRAQGFEPLDARFPVFRDPRSGEEYALARRETKQGAGHKGFVVDAGPDVTLEEDLRRRDLTINAMAQAADGTVVDPFGGRDDLDAGLLRHVSPAFVEDPLRLLRVARFAARFGCWGFRLGHGVHALMKRMVRDGELASLTGERVWREMERALGEGTPSRFFEVLHRCGALAVVLPELAPIVQAAVHERSPRDGSARHWPALNRAAELSRSRVVRFAALVCGVPGTDAAVAAEAEVKGLCTRLGVSRPFRELAALLARRARSCQRIDPQRSAQLLEFVEDLDALRRPERMEPFLVACQALVGPSSETHRRVRRLRLAWEVARAVRARDLGVTGLQGEALARWLREQRIRTIAEALARDAAG
jgi:tRNA nucleotidyltransferase (CCA-adding enzyme)